MFTRGWPTGETLNFVNYVLHPEKGQKFVGAAGYVPLY
jgi:phosphate transport system substrate-binding protein